MMFEFLFLFSVLGVSVIIESIKPGMGLWVGVGIIACGLIQAVWQNLSVKETK